MQCLDIVQCSVVCTLIGKSFLLILHDNTRAKERKIDRELKMYVQLLVLRLGILLFGNVVNCNHPLRGIFPIRFVLKLLMLDCCYCCCM